MAFASLKLAFPNRVFMLRGNHESKTCTRYYGFEDEVKAKYGRKGHKPLFSYFLSAPQLCGYNLCCMLCSTLGTACCISLRVPGSMQTIVACHMRILCNRCITLLVQQGGFAAPDAHHVVMQSCSGNYRWQLWWQTPHWSSMGASGASLSASAKQPQTARNLPRSMQPVAGQQPLISSQLQASNSKRAMSQAQLQLSMAPVRVSPEATAAAAATNASPPRSASRMMKTRTLSLTATTWPCATCAQLNDAC